MTYLEEFMKNLSGDELISADELIDDFCPHNFFHGVEGCGGNHHAGNFEQCKKCWNREYIPPLEEPPTDELYGATTSPDDLYINNNLLKQVNGGPDSLKVATDDKPKIVDSGHRREFPTGAVRDICEGKGRCDLLPLCEVGRYLGDNTFESIALFQERGDIMHLYDTLDEAFDKLDFKSDVDMILEVAKHFEDGCKKYGENNWCKGIPAHCYIDSAVRHYLKYLRGDTDERHDRAFVWNILCCIWTCGAMPELNDYRKKEEKSDENC